MQSTRVSSAYVARSPASCQQQRNQSGHSIFLLGLLINEISPYEWRMAPGHLFPGQRWPLSSECGADSQAQILALAIMQNNSKRLSCTPFSRQRIRNFLRSLTKCVPRSTQKQSCGVPLTHLMICKCWIRTTRLDSTARNLFAMSLFIWNHQFGEPGFFSASHSRIFTAYPACQPEKSQPT